MLMMLFLVLRQHLLRLYPLLLQLDLLLQLLLLLLGIFFFEFFKIFPELLFIFKEFFFLLFSFNCGIGSGVSSKGGGFFLIEFLLFGEP
jgi:hypothetical protein